MSLCFVKVMARRNSIWIPNLSGDCDLLHYQLKYCVGLWKFLVLVILYKHMYRIYKIYIRVYKVSRYNARLVVYRAVSVP